MKDKRLKLIIAVLLIVLIIIFIVCYVSDKKQNQDTVQIKTESTDLNIEYSEEELSGEWKEFKAKIILSDEKTTIEGSGVTNNGNAIKITSSGTYYITGSISDGNIQIDATKNDDVQIVLDNASITSKATAPINGITANKLTITLADNSENNITDNSSYTAFTDTENQEPDGTIFTKTDLVINGSGKLIVNSNYSDGIVSKDGLKIINSSIEISSQDDAIRGKDYIIINSSKIDITSKGDGIKSTNDTEEELGYIAIENSSISINSEADGIQAESILNVSQNSKIKITTTGEIESSNSQNQQPGGKEFMRGGYTTTTITTASSEDSVSSKGLKAGKEITIENGDISIISTDDTLHSNGIIVINNGIIELSSGDDGIHADTSIAINGGNINITKSYEGIESTYIEINGGTINLVAEDDGINVNGGNDNSAMGGRMSQDNFSNVDSSNKKLVVNGGNLSVNAVGDGLDSNGAMYINGGNILVAGPTSGGNGALDYTTECTVTGGNIIVYGSTGMWQNPSSNSTQYSLIFQYSGKSGDEVKLLDDSGNEIVSFNTEKTYGAMIISNPNIKKGKSYSLNVNGTSIATLEVSSSVTSNVSENSGMGGGMPGNGNMKMNRGR